MLKKIVSQNQLGFILGDAFVQQLIPITHKIHKTFDCSPFLKVGGVLQSKKPFNRIFFKKKKHKLYGPFLWMGSTTRRLKPLRGSLLFTTKLPEIPGTQSIDLGRMKG